MKRRRSKFNPAPWLFLAPSLLLVGALVLVPFCDAVRRSFFSAMGGEFVGLKNYIAVLENEAFRLAAWNTLRFTLVCIPILLVFSLLLALACRAADGRHGLFKTGFLLPLAIPVASMVLLWKVVFHTNGLLNQLLAAMGIPSVDWLSSSAAFFVLVFSYLWKNAGYGMVIFTGGLSDISPALYEAAEVDGANAFRRFLSVTLPGLRPTFFTATVLSLMNSFKVFREAYLIGGSYPDESIYMLSHLFNNWFLALDIDRMCAGAVLLAAALSVVVALTAKGLGGDDR